MDYNNDMRYSSNDYSNLRISSNFNLANEIRNSAGSRYYKRNSYINDDGTTTEIKKETNMSGKEELLEITYDPQGNIIGRKKADGGRSSVKFSFHELQDYSTYDPMNNYNIYEGGNVYVQTVPTTEIVYEPIETYTVDYSNINNNYEHDFGSRGYSLMDNNISSGQMVELNQNTYSTNNNYNNTQSFYNNSNNNENLEKYFVENNTNSYTNQTNNNYNYNNNINYNIGNYNNYFQTTSNNYSNSMNNYNYGNNNQNSDNFQCAKVTKLN